MCFCIDVSVSRSGMLPGGYISSNLCPALPIKSFSKIIPGRHVSGAYLLSVTALSTNADLAFKYLCALLATFPYSVQLTAPEGSRESFIYFSSELSLLILSCTFSFALSIFGS